jgi:hypothetical protein
MHPYDSDAKNSARMLFYITLAAAILTFFLYYLQEIFYVAVPWYIGWMIDAPTIGSFYGIFYKLFDNFLWRYTLKRLRPFSTIPDLKGTWKGELVSSYNNTAIQVIVYIHQTWSKLLLELESDTSRSYTIMAKLNVKPGRENGLRYEYYNELKKFGTTPEHRGSGHLLPSSDGKTLTGKYYTSEGSSNTGTIILHLLTKEILDYEEALTRTPLP